MWYSTENLQSGIQNFDVHAKLTLLKKKWSFSLRISSVTVTKSAEQKQPKACNFGTLAKVLSCEFCEISKNTFFTEHLWTTASANVRENSFINIRIFWQAF